MIRWKRMLSSIMAILIAASLTSPSYTFAESLSIYGTSTNFAGIAGTENDTAEQEVSGQADGGEGEEAEEAEDDAAWEEEAAEGGSVQEPDPEEAGEEDDAAEHAASAPADGGDGEEAAEEDAENDASSENGNLENGNTESSKSENGNTESSKSENGKSADGAEDAAGDSSGAYDDDSGAKWDDTDEEAVWEDAAELRTITADVARAALYEEEEPTAVYAYVDRFLHALYDRDVQPKEKPGRTIPLTVEVTGVLPADVTAAAEIIEFEDEPEDGNESFRERTLFYINLALYDGEGTVYIPEDFLEIELSGKTINRTVDDYIPVQVYSFAENEERSAKNDWQYAADVLVFMDQYADADQLAFRSNQDELVWFWEDNDGLIATVDNTIWFKTEAAGPSLDFVVSAQMSEEEEAAAEETAAGETEEAAEESAEGKESAASVSEKTETETETEESGKTDGTEKKEEAPASETRTLRASVRRQYVITAELDASSGIPAGAELAVSEIGASDPAYDAYVEKSAEELEIASDQVSFARAFDIKFVDPQTGEEYQPDGSVKIGIRLLDENIGKAGEVDVVHFREDEKKKEEIPEVMDADVNGRDVEFETGGFSVYVVLAVHLEKTITAGDGNTYTVSVTYDESAGLPTDAELDVRELTGEDYLEYVAKTAEALETESLDFARIFDINIVGKDGTQYQPNAAVEVYIQLIGEEVGDELSVVHFGTNTEILDSVQNGNKISFQTDSFSVYSLAGQHLRTYRFFTYDNATNMRYVEYHMYTDTDDTTFTQVIKNAEEGLVAPQLPSLEGNDESAYKGYTFSGWYVASGVSETGGAYTYTSISDTAFDFDHIPEVTETETVYLFAKFADYAYAVFHDQYNGSTHTFPVAETRRGEKTGSPATATIQISDVSVAYDDDTSSENSAPGYAFYGWSYTPITTVAAVNDDHGDPVSRIETDEIDITETVHLYPIFKPIHWLTFYSGPTGSGATYIPSAYYYEGEGPDHLMPPVRSGYTFDGWYLGTLTSVENGDGTTTETVTYDTCITNADGSLINGASGEGVSVSDGKLLLTGNVTLYAKWTAAAVNYSIVIWRQSANDAAGISDALKTYDYAESVTLSGISGQSVSVSNIYKGYAGSGEYIGFAYSRCDDAKTIAADGSTALNVYYDRICYTLKFYFARSNSAGTGDFAVSANTSTLNAWTSNNSWKSVTATNITAICTNTTNVDYEISGSNRYYYYFITANYGADIADQWPSYDDFPKIGSYNLVSWVMMTGAAAITGTGSGANTVKGLIATMDEQILGNPSNANGNFLTSSYSEQTPNEWTYNIYYPVLSGETYENTVTYNGVQYYLFDTIAARSRGTSSTSQHAPSYVGYTFAYESQNSYVMNYYYSRNSYNLEFWDSYTHQMAYVGNTQQTAISVSFGDAVEGHVIGTPSPKQIVNVNGTPTAQDRDGYNFTYWYADEGCSTRVFFHQLSESELSSMKHWVKNEETGAYEWDGTYNPYVVYDTMPNTPVKVYAGWETIWYKVVLDPNYGWLNDGTGTGSTWFWEPYNGDPIQEYSHVSRDYVESSSGTFYYHYDDRDARWPEEWSSAEDSDRQRYAYYTEDLNAATELTTFKYAQNAYRYAGWYEVNQTTGEETLYNFGEPITHDTYLTLHWKKIGTYYVEYNAVVEQSGATVSGTLDSGDSNEPLFVELDGDDYADNAEVVVTRIAEPPEGYNFVGWRIRGDDSGTVYYPGQSFTLLAKYTAAVNGRETIFLDAVYTRIGTAQIIYNANGGLITGTPDYGGPTEEDAPEPTTSYDADAGTATIRNLVNNSEINLSDGTGFAMENATLVGWNTAIDGSGDHFELDEDYYVDTEDPVTLYAEWQVKVYYHLNHTETNWGGNWDDVDSEGNPIFTHLTSPDDVQYQELLVNSRATPPTVVPQYTGEDDLTFKYWGTVRYSGDVPVVYDFSSPVTGELHLYGYWDAPVQLPIHVVDTTNETMAEEVAWRRLEVIEVFSGTSIQVGTEAQAAVYTQVPTSPDTYAFAFTAVKKSTDELSVLTEDSAVTSVYYNAIERCLYVTYADTSKADAPLANTDELYFVYFKDPETLNIDYKWMDTDRSLNAIAISGAPTTASVNPEVEDSYAMASYVTGPLSYLTTSTDRDKYKYYAYAIGSVDAASDTQLSMITSAVSTDSSRPALYVKNTWRGFTYSADGMNWISAGYSTQLYVIYFESLPTVLTLNEQTIGTAADMNEEFAYTMRVTETTTISAQTKIKMVQYKSQHIGNSWQWVIDKEGDFTDSGSPTVTHGTPVSVGSTEYLLLSNGHAETVTIFYTAGNEQIGIENTTTQYGGNYTNPGNGRTKTDITTRTVTTTAVTQTVTITQTKKDAFDVDHSGTGDHHVSATVYTYTTTATSYSEDPSVTYTNVRPKQAVEVHVALVGSGGTVTLDDVQRSSSSYSFEIPIDYPTSDPANTKTFLTEIPSETLFTGDNTYGFAGIIYGTDGGGQGDTVMIAGAINSTVTYGHISDTVYELYFDDTTSRLKGENNIYYLYYPLPKLVYVKETAGGALEKIKGSTNGSTVSDTITYNGSALTFNGASVEQEQLLSVSKELFTITQTVAAGNFNMPPLLDDGTDKLYLTYSKIGAAGTADAASTSALAAVSETKLLYLKVVDNQVKWSIDSTNWNSFTGTSPTVYAIYKEKGYSLEVTKALAEDTGNTFTKNFTVTISSMSIIASSYEVTGTGYNTISATPANGATPGSITLTMRDGSDIRISGLAKGDYTVTETEDIGYTLSAQAGDAEGTLSDWTVTGATLNAITLNTDKKVALTNTRNYVEITVKKSLVDTTDTNRFGFYAALTDNGSAVNAKTFGTGAAATTTDSSGRVSAFYLVHNGTKTLTVPVGAVLEIVESAAKDSSEALVEIGNYTATIVASETANAALSYNSGIVDEDSKTYTLDTVPNKALTVTFTNSSGVDIKFKKIDGFGTAQQGAVFSLYTNPGCTTALEVSGTALTGTSDSSGVVIFNNKIPNGIYYMRETTVPAGGYVNSSSRDGSGNPIPNTYIVLVGDKAMGKTELDASAATYLEGITTTVISGQTALYKAEYRDEDSDYDKYAIFLIDSDSTSDTYNKAVATPDIAAYGIMNVSTVTQKVILDKITNTKDTLPGAVFELLAYDRSVMEASLTSGTADEESMRYGGAFYVGRLPQGIYYVHEKTVPSGYDGTKTWWTLTVSRTGAVTLTGPAASAPE